MTRLATAGLAVHVFVELAAGVGMPFASVLGPLPAAGVWAVGTETLWRMAGRSAPADAVLQAWNAIGLAAVLAHFRGWPSKRTRFGVPWLLDCEGLGPPLMLVYNPILYVSAAAALAAVARENRSAPRSLALAALAAVPALVRMQHAEHRRLTALARRKPAWSTRRLR